MFYKIPIDVIEVIKNTLLTFPTRDLLIGQITSVTQIVNRLNSLEKLPEEKPKEEVKPEPKV